MSAPSATQLCNRALHLIGEKPITDINSDTTDVAQQCQLIYDDALLELLVAHPWNFAVTRQALALLPDAPVYDWSFAFAVPTDPPYLRALDTTIDLSWGSAVPWPPVTSSMWQIEMHAGLTVLMADENPVSLRYIASVTDPVRFSPQFRAALVAELTSRLAYSITEKADLIEVWERKARQTRAWAKTMDGQEGRAGFYMSTALIDVRY